MIGLVPQELHLEAFDTVFSNVNYSRGLWGKNNDYDFINSLLKKLKLSEKRDSINSIVRRNEEKSFDCKSIITQP